jgi:hypothetical protein
MESSFDIGQLYVYRYDVGVDDVQNVRALTIEILLAVFERVRPIGKTINSHGRVITAMIGNAGMLVTAPLTRDIKNKSGGWYRLT